MTFSSGFSKFYQYFKLRVPDTLVPELLIVSFSITMSLLSKNLKLGFHLFSGVNIRNLAMKSTPVSPFKVLRTIWCCLMTLEPV